MLALEPGEKVLDLGCGEGALTEKLVALGAVVVGVDAAAEQVDAARARGLDARVAEFTMGILMKCVPEALQGKYRTMNCDVHRAQLGGAAADGGEQQKLLQNARHQRRSC